MSVFTKDLDDLLLLFGCQKNNLRQHLEKNYKINVHFIKANVTNFKGHGGHNRIVFLLTEAAFELLKNSFNLRNRYLVDVSDSLKSVNIGMCIENQTIGFIENSLKGVISCKRQFSIGKYRIDLFFPEYKLAVECDEYGHKDRDPLYEKIREDFILSQGCKLIRYNPNEPIFDLSNVIQEILTVILTK